MTPEQIKQYKIKTAIDTIFSGGGALKDFQNKRTSIFNDSPPSSEPYCELLTSSEPNFILIGGEAGCGKSALVQEMAMHLSQGKNFLGTNVPHPCLFIRVCLENQLQTKKNQRLLYQLLGQPVHPLDVIAPEFVESKAVEDLNKIQYFFGCLTVFTLQKIQEIPEDVVFKEVVISIDTLTNMGIDLTEIPNIQAINAEVVKLFRLIKENFQIRTTVIGIVHTYVYSNKERISGSMSIQRIANYTLVLNKQHHANYFTVAFKFLDNKFKNAMPPQLKSVHFIPSQGVLLMQNSEAYSIKALESGGKPKTKIYSSIEEYQPSTRSKQWENYLEDFKREFPNFRSATKLQHMEAIFINSVFHDSHKDKDWFKRALSPDKANVYEKTAIKTRVADSMGENFNQSQFNKAWSILFQADESAHLIEPFHEKALKAFEQALGFSILQKHPIIRRIILKNSKSREEN